MLPPSTFPAVLIIFLSLLQLSHSSYFFWGYYPACAQPQLDANAPADCIGLGASCLCASRAFLTGSAQAIWAHCGCDVLETSANVAQSICSGIGSIMAVTPAQMISAGDGGESTCANPSGLASSTSSPSAPSSITSDTGSGSGVASSSSSSSSSNNSNTSGQGSGGGGGGLSTRDQIVIGVVIPVIGIIVAIIIGIIQIRRGKTRGLQVP